METIERRSELNGRLLRRYLEQGGDLETLAYVKTRGVWDTGASMTPTIAAPLWPRINEPFEAWQRRVGRIIVAGGASAFYGKGLEHIGAAQMSFTSDTMKVALVTSAYSPNLSTHEVIGDLGATRVGTDQTLTTKTNTLGVFNADAATWSGGAAPATGQTVAYLVIWKDSGTAGTSWLFGQIDTATNLPLSTNGGSVSVTWSTGANKLAKL